MNAIILPYGSFWETVLMGNPLTLLCIDLQKLGWQLQPQVCEPDDPISALCEVIHLSSIYYV